MDIGCGGGFYSLATLRKKCKDVILLDIFPVTVKAAKLNLLENISFESEGVIAEATNLPFRSEYFDFILCIDLIEHVRRDDVLLREIGRVLKGGGFMLLATQNSNSINFILEAPIQRYVFKNRDWMGSHTRKILYIKAPPTPTNGKWLSSA